MLAKESYQNSSNGTCCMFEDPLLPSMLPPILIVICVLGSAFNGLALWVFCVYLKEWKSSMVYLFNLSVADFLLNICLPFRTDYYLKQMTWTYGDFPCRLMLFMLALNRGGSIFFLTLVALDRYIRVIHPHSKINSVSTKTATGIACTVWLATMVMAAFLLTKSHSGDGSPRKAYCDSFMVCPGTSQLHDIFFITKFFLPLCIVLFCNGKIIWRLRQRNLNKHKKVKKAVKCISLVGVVFFVCYLPSVSTRIVVLRLQASPEGNLCNIYKAADTAFYTTICLTYMNSMCNPLLYYFSSPSFRKFYLKIMKCSSQAESESDSRATNPNNSALMCNQRIQTETQNMD